MDSGLSKQSAAGALASVSAELYQTRKLIDSSLDIICASDEAGYFTFINAACQQVLGYTTAEMTGRHYTDFVVPEDKAATIAARDSVRKGTSLLHFENHYRHKDGHEVPLSWTAYWDAAERMFYCTARDIREKKEAKASTKAQEEKYYRAYKLARIGWWEVDGKTHTAVCSDELFEMYGLPKPADRIMSRATYFSIIPPEEAPTVAAEMLLLFEKDAHRYEHHVLLSGGKKICVVHQAEAIRDEWGNVAKVHGTARDVTEERAAQKALKASEKKAEETAARLNEILEHLGDGFIAMNRDFTVTYWNRKAEELIGLKKEAIIGKSIWGVYPDAVNSVFHTEYKRALSQNTPVQFEALFPEKNIWIEVSAYPSENGLSVFFKNNTEKRKREQALRQSNERFELASKATSDVIWDWDVPTGAVQFNKNYSTIFGYPFTLVDIEAGWVNQIHAADRERVWQKMKSAHADPLVYYWEDEYRFHRADAGIAHVHDRGTIVRDEAGSALRMIGAMSDVTRKKESEAELKKLSLVAENTGSIVIITDAQEGITWVNKAFTGITGYTLADAAGKKPGELMQGPETNQSIRAYMRNQVRERLPFKCEIVNYKKSGEKMWVEIIGQPLFDEQGALLQYFSIQTDITERKEAEEAIALSEQRYRLLFYESPKPKWIFNAATHKIVEANQAALDLYGYARTEFLNLAIPQLRLKDEVASFYDMMENGFSDQRPSISFITRHVKSNGTVFNIELTAHRLNLPNGIHFMMEGKDMTEVENLQRTITEEKIAAQKEVMKAIIHTQEKERSDIGKELHDNVNQILTTAKLYIENIRYFPDQREAFIEKSTSLVQKSINEIRLLSKALVTPTINDLGFKETLHELVGQFAELALFQIQFVFKTGSRAIDKGIQLTIYRIVQEQLNNIVKYALASKVLVSVLVKEGQLVVRIEDDGVGFDAARKNSGLGLNNIHNRAGAYKGQVRIKAALGKGCRIKVVFPL